MSDMTLHKTIIKFLNLKQNIFSSVNFRLFNLVPSQILNVKSSNVLVYNIKAE